MIYINADHPANAERVIISPKSVWVHGYCMVRRDLEMQRVHMQAVGRVVEDAAYVKLVGGKEGK